MNNTQLTCFLTIALTSGITLSKQGMVDYAIQMMRDKGEIKQLSSDSGKSESLVEIELRSTIEGCIADYYEYPMAS